MSFKYDMDPIHSTRDFVELNKALANARTLEEAQKIRTLLEELKRDKEKPTKEQAIEALKAKYACSLCKGKGHIGTGGKCGSCSGNGFFTESNLPYKFKGKAELRKPYMEKCPVCNGSGGRGSVKCYTCNGTGEKTVGNAKPVYTCPDCNGSRQGPSLRCSLCCGDGISDKRRYESDLKEIERKYH